MTLKQLEKKLLKIRRGYAAKFKIKTTADVICMTILASEKMGVDIEKKWFRHLKK